MKWISLIIFLVISSNVNAQNFEWGYGWFLETIENGEYKEIRKQEEVKFKDLKGLDINSNTKWKCGISPISNEIYKLSKSISLNQETRQIICRWKVDEGKYTISKVDVMCGQRSDESRSFVKSVNALEVWSPSLIKLRIFLTCK